jgi:hypothetical protein
VLAIGSELLSDQECTPSRPASKATPLMGHRAVSANCWTVCFVAGAIAADKSTSVASPGVIIPSASMAA